eukprot:1910667-Amphidinium_carterae.1
MVRPSPMSPSTTLEYPGWIHLLPIILHMVRNGRSGHDLVWYLLSTAALVAALHSTHKLLLSPC